jgi:hypothetical protein
MKRVLFTMFVVSVVLGVAVLAAGKATHMFYTTESTIWFGDSPLNYVTHEANGWLFIEGFPIYGNYQRHYDGETDSGALLIEVKGKASLDGADGNFEGPVSLYIDGMDCVGRFRNKRVDFQETGSWVLQCPDGSKIQDTYHFIFTPPVSAVEGSGRLLTPHG